MITWKLVNGRLLETSNELDAVSSSIYNILTTCCGEFDIFSWNYGNQLLNLLGTNEIYEKIETYIESCLLTDDRITSVENILFSKVSDEINISFEVNTIFGTISNEVTF
ncbi:MAG: DUF2634 domain-containing protein [Clostridia bacterium]